MSHVEDFNTPLFSPGLVSIVMPAYNKESVLAESIGSVLGQTFSNWELLVIDDASEDGTLQVARKMSAQDERIRVVTMGRNQGVAHARNAGIGQARGQFLSFLDADDLWLPTKLEVQVEFMRRRGSSFTFASYCRFDGLGFVSGPVRIPEHVGYESLLKGNAIGCLTVMIDRHQIGQVVMPNVGHEDYVAWLQILKQGHTAVGIQQDLARYRISSASISGDKRRSAIWTWNIYRKTEGLSLLHSLWCFVHYIIRSLRIRYVG